MRGAFLKLDVERRNRQLAALLHRVARVDREVHQDLLDLRWVRDHGPEAGRQRSHDLDVLADESTQHAHHIGGAVIEAHRDRRQRLPLAECEQLPREPSSAVGCAPPITSGLVAVGVA